MYSRSYLLKMTEKEGSFPRGSRILNGSNKGYLLRFGNNPCPWDSCSGLKGASIESIVSEIDINDICFNTIFG